VRGGGQEKGLRAGTENVAAVTGFGAAARVTIEARDAEMERLASLRDAMEARVAGLVPDVVFFGQGAPRLAQTSAFAAAGVSAETLLIALDLVGVAASSGSACSSGKVQPSRVARHGRGAGAGPGRLADQPRGGHAGERHRRLLRGAREVCKEHQVPVGENRRLTDRPGERGRRR